MKLLTLITISLFSLTAFGNVTCKNASLKDGVETCYKKVGNGFYSNNGVYHSGNTSYVLEYECDLEIKHTTTARDNAAAGNGYKSTTHITKKGRVSRKKVKNYYKYCMQVADHIEKNGEYPGATDQLDYFGNILGMGTKEDLKK